MSSSQQINATSAQVQATNEGTSIPVAATIPVISAPVLPLGLSSVPTPSVISPFTTPVPSPGPRVTFPPSMTQFMNDPANLQAIRGFGQVMAMCQQSGGMPFLPGMFPFALPGAGTMPLQAPMAVTSFHTPMPQPSPFQPQLVSTMAPVNLTGALNAAGPSRPPQGEVREAEPARTWRSRSNRQEPARTRASRQEEEAESQPRLPVTNRLTVPNDRVQQMEAKLERLEKKVVKKNDRDKPLAGSPFTTRVHLTPFPRKVKINAPRFTGKEDPEIHLDSFNQSATMNGCTDEEKCLLFFQTLRNRATEWFNKLHPGSIDSFSDLASKFKAKFQENCTKRKKFTYLSTAGQRESENLTQFLTRWKEEVDKVEEMDDKTVLSLLLNGLRAGELYKEFCRKPPSMYQEAYHIAWEFAEAETQLREKKEAEHGYKPKPVQVKKEEAPGPSRPRHHYEPVVRMVNTRECQEIRKAPVIPPENATGQIGRQWSGTYCSYHRSDSHNTSECKSVKGVIRQMIDSGELGKDYLQKAQEKSHQWVRPTAPGDDRNSDRRRNNRPRERQPAPGKEHIGMIFGGPEGGDSAAQRKNWVWSIYVGEVSAEPPRRKHTRREPIVFTDRDLPPTGEDHNDPLVITMDINGVDVAWVLVDTGSSVDILYLETFQKLRLCRTQLEPLKTPLSGFTGDTVEAEGSIVLPVELGSGEKTVWKKMRFIVVDIKCVHNAILGRPDINKVGAMISMPHLCMKFHTPGGVGEVKGDQRNARECYARAVKKMTKGVNVISQEMTKGETREKLEPEAETVEIELHSGDSSRMVRVGANLPEDLMAEITRVLQEYAGIFAWSVADMPGIDRSVICHRLAVREGSRPVRQKKRYLASDRRDFVKKEVKDLLSVGHIREVKDDGAQKPIYYVSKALNGAESRYTAMEKTAYALFISAKKLTFYFQAHPVEVLTDQPLVDGASGPRGYGGGIVFTTPEGFKIYHAIVFNFKLTNNEAEYEALAGGLRLAQALKISRAENADADLLSELTQYAPEHVSKLARVEILDRASIEKLEVDAITAGSQYDRSNLVGADDHWMYDLMEYLMDGSLPEQDDRARKVKLRAPRFQVLDGKLYKRAFGGPLLRCLTNREAERVIAEVHEGVCAAHQMSRTLSQRIILLGYYWPTIVQDCERYVQKCRTCQVFYKYPGRPATYYHPVSNVIPFARFGVNIIGAFLVAQGGKKFVIVAIDYFTKWIEAEALANITTQQCKKFIWKNIITRFGAPMNLITDNGPQFRNPRFTEYFEGFGIKHNRSSVAYPQGNGQVENANRTIVDGLKKRLGEARNKWLEELPHIVWEFRVTPRRAHGETPFSLTYGCEARLPIEAEFPTFRESNYQPQQNEEDHLAELNLVEERRMAAEVKMSTYQQVVKKYHDNKVGPRYFQVGDEVLRRREASRPGDGGKLAKN
ncbi:unnamed protein product [Cuscuta campestris]|uniref:Integrase catalytic domain-containing protein n=1 Tax=Cuscuta campestris TaxID=132261 RepID=A0A484N9I7_9ASTE|nr:unnamed protein product [Cuscuta campestris]